MHFLSFNKKTQTISYCIDNKILEENAEKILMQEIEVLYINVTVNFNIEMKKKLQAHIACKVSCWLDSTF